MAASFRTCGLYPVDKEQVIRRLPRLNREDVTANRQLLDETFGERLKDLRGVDQPKKQKRGKKVAPGKCFTAVEGSSSSEEEVDNPDQDEEVESEEEVVRPGPSGRKRAAVQSSSSSSSESEPEALPEVSRPGTGTGTNTAKGKSVPGSSQIRCKNMKPAEVPEYVVGTFVVAMYEGSWYIGQVEGEDPDEELDGFVLIKYMERKGENRFVLSEKDLLKTLNSDILLKIDPPIPVNNRGFFGLPQDTLKRVELLVKEWSILPLRTSQILTCPVLEKDFYVGFCFVLMSVLFFVHKSFFFPCHLKIFQNFTSSLKQGCPTMFVVLS